nr:uncharacterized protein LOC118035301 [Populus alba]XP_034928305.1 uncharacterized protein LOC118059531 [Populus alba]
MKEKVEERRVQKWAKSIPFMSFKKHGPCGAFASSFFNLPIQNRRRLNKGSPFQRSNILFLSSKPNCVYINEERKPLSSSFSHASLSGFSKSSLSSRKTLRKIVHQASLLRIVLRKETSIQTYFCINMAPRFSQAFRQFFWMRWEEVEKD